MKKLILIFVLLFIGVWPCDCLAGDIMADLTSDIIVSSQTSEKVNANWNALNHVYQVMQQAVSVYDGKVSSAAYTVHADSIAAKIQAFLDGLTVDEREYLNWNRQIEEKKLSK